MNKKRIIVLALMIFCSLMVWAGGNTESAAASPATGSKVVVDEWEIPFLNVLTGPIGRRSGCAPGVR